jgi:hypothetical protein
MTDLKTAFPIPAISVNNYLWDALKFIDETLDAQYEYTPIFPIADSKAGDQGWGNKTYVVYDQLMKFRAKPFYGVHKTQTMYFIRGDAEGVLSWTNAIAHILDREDSSARDINEYNRDNDPSCGIFFHSTKVFQVDSTNEERMDLAVRQYYTASMIVEMNYHLTNTNGFD